MVTVERFQHEIMSKHFVDLLHGKSNLLSVADAVVCLWCITAYICGQNGRHMLMCHCLARQTPGLRQINSTVCVTA